MVVAHDAGPVAVRASDNTDDLRNQVKRLSDNQLDLYTAVTNDVSRVNSRLGRIEKENAFQQVAMQTPVSLR